VGRGGGVNKYTDYYNLLWRLSLWITFFWQEVILSRDLWDLEVASQIITGDPRLSRWGRVHDFLTTIVCMLHLYSSNDAFTQPNAFLQNFKIVMNWIFLKITKKKVPHTTVSFYKSQREVSEPCRTIEILNPAEAKAIRCGLYRHYSNRPIGWCQRCSCIWSKFSRYLPN
jgi:hypothetical protein